MTILVADTGASRHLGRDGFIVGRPVTLAALWLFAGASAYLIRWYTPTVCDRHLVLAMACFNFPAFAHALAVGIFLAATVTTRLGLVSLMVVWSCILIVFEIGQSDASVFFPLLVMYRGTYDPLDLVASMLGVWIAAGWWFVLRQSG